MRTVTSLDLEKTMLRCIELAKEAAAEGNYPLGALVLRDGEVLAESGSSLIVDDNDPSAHPEMVVIRRAATAAGSRYLPGALLFTTLEPCPMCSSAAVWAKMRGIVYGASQEDATRWAANNPHDLYTWRQIGIHARDVVNAGTPRLELHENVLRQECIDLYDLTRS